MLERFQVHASQRADDLQMAAFLRPDVHQQILAFGVVIVQALNRILHGRRELAVGASELLQQHVPETRIGLPYPHRVHQLLHMVVHSPAASFH